MPANLATLRDLKARVDAAEGPDRELDALLMVATGWASEVNPKSLTFVRMIEDGRPDDFCSRALDVTASIDAAVALIERICPSRRLEIGMYPSGHVATLRWYPDGLRGDDAVDGFGESRACPALAAVSALLAALIVRAEAKEPAYADA